MFEILGDYCKSRRKLYIKQRVEDLKNSKCNMNNQDFYL